MLTTFDLEVERFYLRIGVQIKLIQKIAIARDSHDLYH